MGHLKTHKFGEVVFREDDVLHFEAGLPGFEHLKRFLLLDGAEYAPFKFFQSVEDPHISLPLLRPQAVYPDYHFDLSEEHQRSLELEKSEEAAVLCVVTITSDPQAATINLFAPVVINVVRRKGIQVILFGSGHPVAAPLISSASDDRDGNPASVAGLS